MFNLRYNSFDEKIYTEIYVNNSYRILDLSDKNVIDIGAHIGCFIKNAVEKNAKMVDAYEMCSVSYEQCLKNIRNYDNVKLSQKVVWSHSGEKIKVPTSIIYSKINEQNILNTGGETLMFNIEDDYELVDSISLDDIVSQYESIGLIKIDCEGSEYPILYNFNNIDKVESFVIEFHCYALMDNVLIDYKDKCNEIDLKNYLESKGFSVYLGEIEYMTDHIYHGLMFVFKEKNIFDIDYLINGSVYSSWL